MEGECGVCHDLPLLLSRYLNTKIRDTLSSSRTRTDVKLHIEPFPPSVAARWFEKEDKRGDSLHFTVCASSHHERFDEIFGEWRKVPVVLDGHYNDGWWEVCADRPVRIKYSASTLSLELSFKASRYNKNGIFQGLFMTNFTGIESRLW